MGNLDLAELLNQCPGCADPNGPIEHWDSCKGWPKAWTATAVTEGARKMPVQKPGRSRQDYGTPPALLAAIKKALKIESFWRDLAASHENAVCPRYYTEADNALLQPWETPPGEWNWCNPPFGVMAPWVGKAYDEMLHFGSQTIMLVPAGVGSNWWAEWVHMKCRVWFIRPRLTFVGETQPYPKDCALLQYGRSTMRGYGIWKWK